MTENKTKPIKRETLLSALLSLTVGTYIWGLILSLAWTIITAMAHSHSHSSSLFTKSKLLASGLYYLSLASFKTVTLKWLNVFSASLLYLFASLLGLADGLLARYIRTTEGGRESTLLYHSLWDISCKLPFLLVLVYLILPFTLNPEWMILLLAMVFFGLTRLTGSHLKKFL